MTGAGGPKEGRREIQREAVRKIDADYYDQTEYFGAESRHLRNMDSTFQRYRVEKVLQIHRPGKEARVLDLGCGWGTITFALAPLVRSVVGLDFSTRSVAVCGDQARKLDLDNVHIVRGDATRAPFTDERFDVVYAADLLEHLYPDQTERALDEVARVLKRGGRLVLWTPNRGHILEHLKNRTILLKRDPTHVDYKSMERIHRSLVKREFSIEKAYYAESHLPGLRELERTFMASVPLLRRRIAVLARKR